MKPSPNVPIANAPIVAALRAPESDSHRPIRQQQRFGIRMLQPRMQHPLRSGHRALELRRIGARLSEL